MSSIEYLFVTFESLLKIDDQVTAIGASARLGSLIPMRALAALGYDARTVSVSANLEHAEAEIRRAKRVVFGEMFGTREGWSVPARTYRLLFESMVARQERAIVSIAHDHFDDEQFRDFYAAALPDCLAVTTVSEQLAVVLRRYTSRPVHVAPEPYEGARHAPRAISARKPLAGFDWLAKRAGVSRDIWRVHLLWFGYPLNLPPLLSLVPELEHLSREYPLAVTCVTNPVPEIVKLATPEYPTETASLRVNFVPWSPKALEPALAACDLVIVPAEFRNPLKQAKSPNRLISGLHAGRFVIAHPLPTYLPYADYAWIGEDLCEGIQWAIRHPREVLDRVTRGQAYIDTRHSPEVVARFWLDVFHPKAKALG